MTEKIVMLDDPEAAVPHTMQGWKSRNGFFFADESTARYAGCTHVPCRECGSPAPKGYTMCAGCRDLADLARYEAMPGAAWDGVAMLYSQTCDGYFVSPDDAEDALDDGQTLADLRLVICRPNYVRPLGDDYCCDELADDMDVPAVVAEAMDAFNKAVAGVVLSWSPGKTRLISTANRSLT